MLQQEISKKCADSLRAFSQENYQVKLKASHAHELVAAYFGYSSKNALLADEKYPISKIEEADIFVMMPDKEIDKRRENLIDMSDKLPNSYRLGEAVYSPLFADSSLYKSDYPPFKSFIMFAKYYVENSQRWKDTFLKFGNFQLDHIFEVEEKNDLVTLTIVHTSKSSDGTYIGIGQTVLTLPRVAGKVGFLEPKVHLEKWTGKARKHFKPNNGGQNA